MLPNDYPRENYMALLVCICHPISPDKALNASGLLERAEAVKPADWPDERLLEVLREKAEVLQRFPTIKDIDHDPALPSGTLYPKRFGTFKKALELM